MPAPLHTSTLCFSAPKDDEKTVEHVLHQLAHEGRATVSANRDVDFNIEVHLHGGEVLAYIRRPGELNPERAPVPLLRSPYPEGWSRPGVVFLKGWILNLFQCWAVAPHQFEFIAHGPFLLEDLRPGPVPPSRFDREMEVGDD